MKVTLFYFTTEDDTAGDGRRRDVFTTRRLAEVGARRWARETTRANREWWSGRVADGIEAGTMPDHYIERVPDVHQLAVEGTPTECHLMLATALVDGSQSWYRGRGLWKA